MIISQDELDLIKEYINIKGYQFIYELDYEAGIKTKEYRDSKLLTDAMLAEIILLLSIGDCFEKALDDNPDFDNGIIYKFKRTYENDLLYIKVKLHYDSTKMLIFSIHLYGDYRRI